MDFWDGWRQRADEMTSSLREVATTASKHATAASQRLAGSLASGLDATGAVVGGACASVGSGLNATGRAASEAYTAALSWKDNSEFSEWLKDYLTTNLDSKAKAVSEAMDAVYNNTHIRGYWHRLYDGTHTIPGSWNAAMEALPDADALERLGAWANSYWNDVITQKGMPIITLDSDYDHEQYLKYLDSFNLAELLSGPFSGVSIYCNWNDPARLVASASATDCGAAVYANVVAPLVSLIALGRAYYLLKQSEQDDLQNLLAPALKGLTRGGASILLITVIPGGFLVHLSSGIVISLAHGYIFNKASENKDAILEALKQCLERLPPVRFNN
jgi:hypothetical protein